MGMRGHREVQEIDRVLLSLSMIFAENRCTPRIKSGAGFFGIML